MLQKEQQISRFFSRLAAPCLGASKGLNVFSGVIDWRPRLLTMVACLDALRGARNRVFAGNMGLPSRPFAAGLQLILFMSSF